MEASTRDNQYGFDAGSRRSLWIALVLISSYMLVEVVGGLMASSLALLADAGHMVTDAGAIGLALIAMWVATRPPSADRSFGFHRTEILAALLNAMSLWLIAAWIFFEAYRRFFDPPEAHGLLMLAVGFVGLLVNIAAAWILRRSAHKSLNVEAAFLHVLGDLLGSIGVIAAGLLIIFFGWFVADPIFGVIIGTLILFSSSRLLWKVLHVLMEGTPPNLNLGRLCKRIEQVDGIEGIHDIHAWSLTTAYQVFSAHVAVNEGAMKDSNVLLQRVRQIASGEFGIAHVTIQLENATNNCAESHHIPHD